MAAHKRPAGSSIIRMLIARGLVGEREDSALQRPSGCRVLGADAAAALAGRRRRVLGSALLVCYPQLRGRARGDIPDEAK